MLDDVRNEMISAGTAREDYGVVIVPEPLEVDCAATEAERGKRRSSSSK